MSSEGNPSTLGGSVTAMPETGAGAAPSATRTVRIGNNSYQEMTFAIFEDDASIHSAGAIPVVWQQVRLMPYQVGSLSWQENYSLTWSVVGPQLVPGINALPAQVLAVDPLASNTVDFSTVDSSYNSFINLRTGPPGSLVVNVDATMVGERYAVGVGLSGNQVCVARAVPGQRFTYTPPASPSFWLCTGTSQVSEVIDPTTVASKVEITLPPSGTLSAFYNPDGTWRFSP